MDVVFDLRVAPKINYETSLNISGLDQPHQLFALGLTELERRPSGLFEFSPFSLSIKIA